MLRTCMHYYSKYIFIKPNKNKYLSILLALFIFSLGLCISCQLKPKPDQHSNNSSQVVQSLLNQANVYWKKQEYANCLKSYQAIYSHYQKSNAIRNVDVLQHIAACYTILRNAKDAENTYYQALILAQKNYGKIHEKLASIHHSMALFYIDKGRYTKAKEHIETALGIDDFIYGPVNSSDKMEHMNTQALVYDHIGDYQKAQTLYAHIHDILKRKFGSCHLATEAVKNNLGGIYYRQNNYVMAEHFYKEALLITKQHMKKAPEPYARTLNNIAVLYKTLNVYSQAGACYYSALQINEHVYGTNHVNVGASHNNIAGLYIQTHKYEQAMSHLSYAWVIAELNDHQDLLWHVQDNFRDLFALKKQPEMAIFFGKQAVQTIQNINHQNVFMNQNLAQTFLKSKASVFRNLADLLIDQGRLDEAKHFLKMLKQKEYIDFMGQDVDRGSSVQKSSRTVFNPTEKNMQKKYIHLKNSSILKNVCTIAKEYQQIQQKWIELSTQLKLAQKSFVNFCKNLQHEIQELDPSKYDVFNDFLKQKDKLQVAINELGHQSIAIFFLKTPDKLRMILSLHSISFARETSISTADLNRLIFEFQEKLSSGKHNYLPEAQKLYSLIFGPIKSDLEQYEAKTIMVSLDDTLRYIPLSALHDGKQFVAEKYAISIYTPAASFDIKVKPQEEWSAVAMGVTKSLNGFKALPAVQKELDRIIIETNPLDTQGTLPGEVYQDEFFTIQTFQKAVSLRVPVIHIASHFVFQPGDVDTSFLLLGDGQTLTLKMLDEELLSFNHLDLLTLSACETAVCSKNANGKELESFGVMAQNKGAKSVIATLWQVADDSTGLFMEHFYSIHNTHKNLTKVEALQQVQQLFIHEKIKRTEISFPTRGGNSLDQQISKPEQRDMNYTHPFYWAPFILIGNWL